MGKESGIERAVAKRAEENGWIARKFEIETGDPDHVFFRAGVAMFIEFKSPDESPSKAQRERIREFKNAGFAVFVCDNRAFGYSLVE